MNQTKVIFNILALYYKSLHNTQSVPAYKEQLIAYYGVKIPLNQSNFVGLKNFIAYMGVLTNTTFLQLNKIYITFTPQN